MFTAIRKHSFAALAFLFVIAGCNSDKEGVDPKDKYDRQAMLANYSENLIVPGYQQFETSASQLEAAVGAFTVAPSAATLEAARHAFREAYNVWQQVSGYGFGPADDQMLRNNLNIYPASDSQIESNITSGTYDLQASANLAAKGFPALDYLLFAQPNEAEVVILYTTAPQAAHRKKYLQDLAGLVKQRTGVVYAGWTAGGYHQTFKESVGTAVGSAVGNLVNQLNFEIDLTKRAKVGIPAGKFTAGTPQPEKVEAYYSRLSLQLLESALQAKKSIFMGRSGQGTDGPGLDDYLHHVGAMYNNKPLAEAIIEQFDAALAAVAAVPAPLDEAVISHPQEVNQVYEELQKLIVLTKTDMPAALGVSITYTDNDGD